MRIGATQRQLFFTTIPFLKRPHQRPRWSTSRRLLGIPIFRRVYYHTSPETVSKGTSSANSTKSDWVGNREEYTLILDVSENESFDSWLGYTFGDDADSSSLKGKVSDPT